MIVAALREGRERYNSMVFLATRSFPRFDAVQFGEAIRAHLGPVVNAAARAAPDRRDAIAEPLFDLLLELHARELMSRHPAMAAAWRLLAEIPVIVAAEPARTARAVLNAASHVGPGWFKTMASIGAESLDEFLKAGRLAAWRGGMPELRDAAIAGAKTLKPALVRRVVPDADLATLASDPWWRAGERGLRIVAVTGGHRALGGPFSRPPTVAVRGGRICATDATHWWVLFADAYGQSFVRTHELPVSGAGEISIDSSGRTRSGRQWAAIPELANSSSHASTAHTLAVAFPHSHFVCLVAS